jgi:hypothetical protein
MESHIEPTSLDQIASGLYKIDYLSCGEKHASTCLTCRQLIWTTVTVCESNLLRIQFNKKVDLKGYLLSANVPKGKQVKSILCLSCVDKFLGSISYSPDGQQLLLTNEADGTENAVLFQRLESGAWHQKLKFEDNLVERVAAANGKSQKRPRKAAAESTINHGMRAGKRARPVVGRSLLPKRYISYSC